MSKSNSSKRASPAPTTKMECIDSDADASCPLCLEDMDASDCRFKPCPCGYQICRFCWHRIREEGNERCPACRRIYTDEDIEFLTEAQIVTTKPAVIKKSSSAEFTTVGSTNNNNKTTTATLLAGSTTATNLGSSTTTTTSTSSASMATATSSGPNTTGVLPSRRHLIEIRVIQKNLVYVIGISARIASENILKDPEYFGQFGKIVKIVVNRRNTGAPLEKSSITTSGSAYVTFARSEDAARAISYVDGSVFDGRILRATYGTTKYCSFFLRGVACPNPGCMYLHEEGETDCSFTKEELSSGKMQLHSSLVDRQEAGSLRQFGTMLYRPQLARSAPSPAPIAIIPPSTTTGSFNTIVAKSTDNNTLVGEEEEGGGGDGINFTEKKEIKPISPPINLALYEDEAQLFLNRLSRWNNPIIGEFDDELDNTNNIIINNNNINNNTNSSTNPQDENTSHYAFANGNTNFDPFADGTGNKSSIVASEGKKLFVHPPALGVTVGNSCPTMISKGTLPGFDWNGSILPDSLSSINAAPLFLQKPTQILSSSSSSSSSSSASNSLESSSIVTFKSLSQLRAVGSPVLNGSSQGGGSSSSIASTTPQVIGNSESLDHLFEFCQKQTFTTPNRKAVDASMLEQQFFQEQTQKPVSLASTVLASNGPIKFNQIAAVPIVASTTNSSSNATNSPSIFANSSFQSTPSSSTFTMGIKSNNFKDLPISKVLTGTSNNGNNGRNNVNNNNNINKPPTLLQRESRPLAMTETPIANNMLNTITPPAIPVKKITILTKEKSVGFNGSSLVANSSKMFASPATPISKSNLFTLLEDDLTSDNSEDLTSEASINEEIIIKEKQPQKTTILSLTKTGGDSSSSSSTAATSKNSKKKKKSTNVEVSNNNNNVTAANANKMINSETVTVDSIVPTILKRPTILTPSSSQPVHIVDWPVASNGYKSARSPRYELMSEDERKAWRRWLEDDLKTSRQEEAALRAKIVKLHGEFTNWVNNLQTTQS